MTGGKGYFRLSGEGGSLKCNWNWELNYDKHGKSAKRREKNASKQREEQRHKSPLKLEITWSWKKQLFTVNIDQWQF